MNHLFTNLSVAVLLACAPVVRAQAISPDSVQSESATPDQSSDLIANIVPLYPERVLKKLKITPCETSASGDRTGLLYHNIPIHNIGQNEIISTGKAILVFNSICYGEFDDQALICSSSKDGSNWNKATISIKRLNITGYCFGAGAVYDSEAKRIVLLFSNDSEDGGDTSDSHATDRIYACFGKGGEFSKPKEIIKAPKDLEVLQSMPRSGSSENNFRGICLTQGKHAGRLLFNYRPDSSTFCSIYSDDHGKTWHVGTPYTFKDNCNLPAILPLCEAKDGTIISYIGRKEMERHGLYLYSKDGGETWAAEMGLPEQFPTRLGACYFILNTDDAQGTNSRLLAFSPDYDNKQTLVALSYDWGRTWSHKKVINTLMCWQSCRYLLVAPGTVGFVAVENEEEYDDECGVIHAGFTTFTISWLTDGKDDGIGAINPLTEDNNTPADKQKE